MATTNLQARLAMLPAADRALLDACAAVALGLGATPYLVGGAVRDLLLGRRNLDLDIVIVGDALAVARAAAATLGGAAVIHEAFGTATLTLPDGRALDLITARRETYAAPGALPTVAPADLDADLRRRDFTINALALALAPPNLGALIDPLGGRVDLDAGIVRILHDGSFRDDPTRLLRAVRYAARFTADGDRPFAFDARTAARFTEAVANDFVATVSVQRLAHELVRLLAEPAAPAMLAHLAASGLLAQIEPRLRWDAEGPRRFAALDRWWHLAERPTDRWQGRFALLAAHQHPEDAAATASALHLESAAVILAREAAELRQLTIALPAALTNAALGRALDPFSPAAIVAAAAIAPPGPQADQLIRYLTTIRSIRPLLTGDAIRALGIPPGPIYRDALAALRDHKRDHPTLTTAEEQAFLTAWLRGRGALPPT